jgi:hypothetical protein
MARAETRPTGNASSVLSGCARRIDEAVAKDDWPALAAIDAELKALLGRVAEGERLTPAQHAELRAVATVFERALRKVEEAHGALGRQMIALNDGRRAWLAYASIDEETA